MLAPEAQILLSFTHTINHFRDTTCTKSAKIRNAPNDPKLNFEHLTIKSTLYTHNTYSCGPNFNPFCSTISDFQDTRSLKIGNAPNGLKLNLNT